MVKIGNDWDDLLKGEWDKPYYRQLRGFLKSEYSSRTIYPDMHDIFNALRYTPYNDVKVVILGQDPYHGPGQAHGLCFSVKPGVPSPPSLVNIFKELAHEYPSDFRVPRDGYLVPWAERGVLLLNTVLTVRAGQANSHKGKGWEQLTDRVIGLLNERVEPIVFLLWGANARSKKSLVTGSGHLVLEAPHPSPLSAHNGFFGCGHFVRTNEFIEANGLLPVDWRLP
ncbi:MAG: uracil-DNA glycosylase [Clostridiales Family XIII bacterium]|jgi:uracil-DNA glycosylase|nr:uracil-DNA glycosylase [Clostridiales Family XIII bacterium]